MPYKRTYGVDRAVQTNDATTYTLRLPASGILSGVVVRVRLTNGATSGTEQIVDAVDRISIVHGSRALHSYTGRQAYALASLFMRRRPPQIRTMAVSGVQEATFLIPFGFSLWDAVNALDLARYPNLELRIEYSPTISATTFATGTFTVTVEYHWWDGDLGFGPQGHIECPEVRNFTSAASGTEPLVTLPNDHPLLGVLIFAREAAIPIDTDIVRVRLLEKSGGQELYNRRCADAMSENHHELMLEAIERGAALLANAETLDTDVNFLQHAIVQVRFTNVSGTDYPYYIVRSAAGDRLTMSGDLIDASSPTTVNTLDTTIRTLSWEAIGRGLPHAIYLPLHRWGMPETAYVPRPPDQPILEIEQGGAGADVRVNVLQYVQ